MCEMDKIIVPNHGDIVKLSELTQLSHNT
jgi:hypothetical protein